MNGLEYEREREKRTVDISNMNLSNNACKAPLVESSVYPRFKVPRFFIICHIHNHTSIISSEMQVELKKNTAFT